jgi:hypothetical protein
MTEVLQELAVKISVDNTELSKGLTRFLYSVDAWKKEMEVSAKGVTAAFDSLLKTTTRLAAGITAAGIAVGTHLVKKSLESVDAMAKLSDRTSINIETLYGFKVAAEDVGVSLEAIAGSVTKLRRNVSEAASGNEELAKTFKQVGLDAATLRDMKPEDAFLAVIDALNKVPNEADRTALKMQLLGKSANELTNFLNLGSEEIKNYVQRSKDLGFTVSRFDAAKIEAANDAMTRFGTAIQGAAQRFTALLSPYIKQAADDLTAFFTQGDQGAEMMHGAIRQLVNAVAVFIDTIHVLRIAWAGVAQMGAFVADILYNVFFGIAAGAGYATNLVLHFKDTFVGVANNIGASFDLLWAGLKLGVAEFVLFATRQLAKMLDQTAAVLSVLPGSADSSVRKMETSIREASMGMSNSIGKYATDARVEFNRVKEEAARTGEATKQAWDQAIDTIDEVHAPPIFQELADAADETLEEARQNLTDLVNAPWAQDAVEAWEERAIGAINKVAKETTDKAPGEDNKSKSPFKALGQGDQAYNEYRDNLNKQLQDVTNDQLLWESFKNENIELMTREHLQDIERSEAESQARTRALWQQGYKGRLQVAQTYLSQLETLQNTHSKRAFEVGKVAAIANAVIATYQGAAQALRDVPYPANFVAAGAVIAAGFNNINNIRSTSFGGGGGSGGGTPVAPSVDASTSSSQVGGPGGRRDTSTVNVTLLGDSFSQKAVRSLVDQLSDAAGDGATIRVRG